MPTIEEGLAANRSALAELITAAERSRDVWTTARAPGKWSPSQLVEHVARSYEAGASAVAGQPSGLPTLPSFLRPVARGFLFNRVLGKGRFPKAKTNKAMDPERGPGSPEEGRARLEAAYETFCSSCRAQAQKGNEVVTPTFGRVGLTDYARFMELHTLHHLQQMPEA